MAIVDFSTECWNDPWVQGLTPLEKLLFIYLWTSNHRNISGIFVITPKTISDETGLTKRQIEELLPKLSPKVKYDFQYSLCWVVKHARRQFLRGDRMSDKQRNGIRRHALTFRWHSFFKEFCFAYPEVFSNEEADTLSMGIHTHSMGMDTLGGGGIIKKEEESKEKEKDQKKEEGGMGGEAEEESNENLFGRFWSAYPKKKSRGQAEKAWLKIQPDEQLLATMLATIERAKTSAEWTKDGGQYIPYPATWLNARGWEDEFQTHGPFKPQPGIAAFVERE